MLPAIAFYVLVFLYGIIIGSFLNVCIYRLPQKENIVTTRSHCMSCGYQLRWYDLIPVCSWLALRGRCRNCGAKISVQYPIIEMLNGIFYLWAFTHFGFSIESLLYCFLASALIVLSVIDFRTYEIPAGINILIGCLGVVRLATDWMNWQEYLIGFLAVSVFLYLLYVITKGRAIGGGDVKLMAVAGLLLGWQNIILAFVLGCILGSIIHVIRMKAAGAQRVLAMGPYLAAGIWIAGLYGQQLIHWYLNLLTVPL